MFAPTGDSLGAIIMGSVIFVIGVIVVIANLKNLRRRRRILAMPTSPIARAPGNALVEIKGRISPGEEGLIQTPFSGRYVVWCRVTVQE